MLVGFDLKKDLEILRRAYNDAEGVPRLFNLNLLERINRELGGEFDRGRFAHYGPYNLREACMESWLVSLENQEVPIHALGRSFPSGRGKASTWNVRTSTTCRRSSPLRRPRASAFKSTFSTAAAGSRNRCGRMSEPVVRGRRPRHVACLSSDYRPESGQRYLFASAQPNSDSMLPASIISRGFPTTWPPGSRTGHG